MIIAQNLISQDIHPLKTSDTGDLALKWMDDHKIHHLSLIHI